MANVTIHSKTLKAQPLGADEIVLASAADAWDMQRATITSLLTSQMLTNCTLTNPTMTTPSLGVATATSINNIAFTGVTNASLVMPADPISFVQGMTLRTTGAVSGNDYYFPSTGAVLARTDAAQTFTGTQTFSGTIAGVAVTASGTIIQTSASSAALSTGPNGATNPVFKTVNNIASAATGISITGRAAAAGADITVISSGTDENLVINAKGAGTISLNPTGTGNVVMGRAMTTAFPITQTSASATAFESGLNGGTNPVFRLVNNIASQATGISITGRAAAAGADITVLSSGTDENLVINAKGAGTISLNPTGTGNIVLGRAATGVSLAVTGAVTSSSASAGIGYVTGAGGAVTQTGSATNTVELNTICGQITTFNLTLVAYADVSFTLTNSRIAAGDVVVVSTKTYAGTADGIPLASVQATADGSCIINIYNQGAVPLDDPAVINFAVIKAVAA